MFVKGLAKFRGLLITIGIKELPYQNAKEADRLNLFIYLYFELDKFNWLAGSHTVINLSHPKN